MELEYYSEISSFYNAAKPFFLTYEAETEMMLSTCLAGLGGTPSKGNPPLLCLVREEGEIQLAAMMHPPYPLMLFGNERALPALIEWLIREDWGLSRVTAPKPLAAAFAQLWQDVTGHTHRVSKGMKLHRLQQFASFKPSEGKLRLATSQDIELVGSWLYEFSSESLSLMTLKEAVETVRNKISEKKVFMWDAGRPVSMAGINRTTLNGVTLDMVYTPPEHRKKGFAKSCVAGLSQKFIQSGKAFCTIYTDETNASSHKIYREIGYEEIHQLSELAFSQKSG